MSEHKGRLVGNNSGGQAYVDPDGNVCIYLPDDVAEAVASQAKSEPLAYYQIDDRMYFDHAWIIDNVGNDKFIAAIVRMVQRTRQFLIDNPTRNYEKGIMP